MCKIPKPTTCGHTPYCAKGLCRNCYQREAYVRRRKNPEYVERQRIHQREAYARKCQNPEYVEQRRIRDRKRKRVRPPDYNEKRKLKTFGLTLQDYQQMLDAQNGVCAICGKKPGKRKLSVDHDHKTGIIRGLLCFRCNFGLGWFQDDLKQFRAIAAHLESTNVNTTRISTLQKKPNSNNIHIGFNNGTTE